MLSKKTVRAYIIFLVILVIVGLGAWYITARIRSERERQQHLETLQRAMHFVQPWEFGTTLPDGQTAATRSGFMPTESGIRVGGSEGTFLPLPEEIILVGSWEAAQHYNDDPNIVALWPSSRTRSRVTVVNVWYHWLDCDVTRLIDHPPPGGLSFPLAVDALVSVDPADFLEWIDFWDNLDSVIHGDMQNFALEIDFADRLDMSIDFGAYWAEIEDVFCVFDEGG